MAATWVAGERRARPAMPTEPTRAVMPPTRNGGARMVSDSQPLTSLRVMPVAAPTLRNSPAAPGPSPASTPEPTPQATSDPALKARNAPTAAAPNRSRDDDSGSAVRAAVRNTDDPTAALTSTSDMSANTAPAT